MTLTAQPFATDPARVSVWLDSSDSPAPAPLPVCVSLPRTSTARKVAIGSGAIAVARTMEHAVVEADHGADPVAGEGESAAGHVNAEAPTCCDAGSSMPPRIFAWDARRGCRDRRQPVRSRQLADRPRTFVAWLGNMDPPRIGRYAGVIAPTRLTLTDSDDAKEKLRLQSGSVHLLLSGPW
jgi:hypothetical protein